MEKLDALPEFGVYKKAKYKTKTPTPTKERYKKDLRDVSPRGLSPSKSMSGYEVDEPLQLIEISEEGECKINKKALSVIQNIKTKVGVISVVGPYRTGKSFLLNRLLNQQDGFEIGPTVQSCTRGIWIWGKPVKVSDDLSIILMDTEGLGSWNRTHNIDIKIFTLSVLLSSLFVYNCLNAIDENALETLSLVVNLTNYISSQQKKDTSGVYNQSNYSPYFMWVVRDFSLQMLSSEELELSGEDPVAYWDNLQNQESASKEYLEQSLNSIDLSTVNEDNRKMVSKKNDIRKAIKNFFHQRECSCLFRPVNEEEKLRFINKIPYDELRAPFKKQVEYLIEKIYRNAKPKAINGQALNGQMFAQIIAEYTFWMNNNGMPEINTAWDRVMETEIRRVLIDSIEKIKNQIVDSTDGKIPMDPKDMFTIERQVRKGWLKLLNQPNIRNAPRDKIAKLQEDFMESIDEIFESLFKQNEEESRNRARDLLPRMYQKISDKLKNNGYETIQEFSNEFNRMRTAYLDNTKEPENLKMLENFVSTKVLDDMDEILHIQVDKMVMANQELQGKIESDEMVIKDLKMMLEKEKQRTKEKELELREKNKNIRDNLETEMITMQQQLQNKEDQFKDLERLLKSGWDNNEKAIKEIKEKEIENIQLKCSLEFEKKVNKLEHDYKQKLNHNKKEMKKVFDLTMSNMKSTYDDEINVYKKRLSGIEDKLKTFKKVWVKKDADIAQLQDKIRDMEPQMKMKMEHADLLLRLAGALEEGSTKSGFTKDGDTKY